MTTDALLPTDLGDQAVALRRTQALACAIDRDGSEET
jgi:hypothetical protein